MKIHQFITQVYSSMRYKSKRRGDNLPDFTKEQFKEWLYKNNVSDMWITYLESGCEKNLKPSVDRIDDYGLYEFSNMQLITWRENQIKGVNGEKHHNNSKNKNLMKPVFIWNKRGLLIKECKNSFEVSDFLGCHLNSVSRAITGKRKTIKKHILTNKNFALAGEELEMKLPPDTYEEFADGTRIKIS